ncbi:hypothetical protein B0T26DRAFT_646458 [Lasiosphaeria miniovina]|uniref:SET domain-containing protein n=1 Tax=Lasiosphaeria miniovina TaxID=1954250 RepID=A0AA40DXY9_9PEZI|nr:uncharacterized protein B0T26DRAFT_646458 [Lasiosphaeria miniovina]KAK0717772.1 hypothetical protein B0T26DRAFT_646458 [Lasiosphaeria miniovina]
MRAGALISLASLVAATQHQHTFQRTGQRLESCKWRPPSPRLACAIDEDEEQKPWTEAQVPNEETDLEPPPSRWEGPHGCAGQYCVFANKGFASGRGIVAITTTQNIQRLKQIEKDEYPPDEKPQPDSPPPYVVAAVQGKGLGLLANKTLHRGDTIMKKTPAILVHRAFFESVAVAHQPQDALLDSAVALLPPPLRKEFLAQMGGSPSAILATNSFQMDIGGGGGSGDGHHYGNFPEVSRLNHDCRANAAFHIGADLAHTTTAARDVDPGAELAISYIDPLLPRAARQQRIRHAWGFACGCALCGSSHKAADKSDARLREIARTEAALADFTDASVTARVLGRLVQLYADERLDASVAGAYTLVALNYNMLGDAGRAQRYARLAHEALVIEKGAAHGDLAEMAELARSPRAHFTWRARVRR